MVSAHADGVPLRPAGLAVAAILSILSARPASQRCETSFSSIRADVTNERSPPKFLITDVDCLSDRSNDFLIVKQRDASGTSYRSTYHYEKDTLQTVWVTSTTLEHGFESLYDGRRSEIKSFYGRLNFSDAFDAIRRLRINFCGISEEERQIQLALILIERDRRALGAP